MSTVTSRVMGTVMSTVRTVVEQSTRSPVRFYDNDGYSDEYSDD
jgi:hypothetical protein